MMVLSKQTPLNRAISEFHLELVNDTAQAIQVMTDFGKEVWLPRKLLHSFTDNEDGTCTFELSDEIAEEKGLV